MFNFCAILDTLYLDKAIALYESLVKVGSQFQLYIYCFDEKSKDVLQKMNLDHITILEAADLEKRYTELPRLRKERSKAEFCWTCVAAGIEYILDRYEVDNCTYIDTDLYFFHNPQALFDEIAAAKANMILVPHRFTSSKRDQYFLRRSGEYCSQFNYFDNSPNARKALTWWKEKSFEWCFHIYEKDRMGEQKYLEKFPTLFQGVHVMEHLGGGVAPWNLKQYRLKGNNPDDICLVEKTTGKEFELVFYHFQNIRYLNANSINVHSGTRDKQLKDAIYIPYLTHIEAVREKLRNYDVTFPITMSYASNKLIAYVQKHILKYKVKSLSDIYHRDQLGKNGR